MEQSTSEGATATQVELRTDGFQATLLWERIVSHLERTVKPSRHSYALRSYDNCFPGHKVVDCLMVYMNSVLPKSVKKSQARLLGQKLLLTKVIEDARKKEKTVFRESRLYRFTGVHFWDPPRDLHGSRTAAAEGGGMYRCHSIENINHSNQTAREQKRRRRTNGYMSDSTLASSSLSKRVVQIRSSRGKATPRPGGESHSRSQPTAGTTSPLATEGASAYQHRQRGTHKSRMPWFHSDYGARGRDVRSKYHTPTITEEPPILRSISPPRASPMAPRSPAVADFKVREPRTPYQGRSRALSERSQSPDSTVVSGISACSRDSQDSSLRCRDYIQRPRVVPQPAVSTAPLKHCNGHSDSHPCSGEKDPGWVVYGYV